MVEQTRTAARPRDVVWKAIFAVVVGLLLWLAADVLIVFFAAVLLAIFLRTISDWLGRRAGLSQRLSLLVVMLLLTGLTLGALWLIAPRVAGQVDQLSQTLPASLREWERSLEQYGWGRWLLARMLTANEALAGRGDWLARVGGLFSSTLGAIVNFALILIVGLYLAAEADRYTEGLLMLFPPPRRARAREVVGVVGHTLRWWMLGQMISMSFLGVFAFLGLILLGIPLALTLAILTALLTFIPNLGPILSVVPPVILALAQSPAKALYVVLFYIVLQNLEGYFITPMVQRKAISLPPAVLISAQVLFTVLLGFWGLLMAAPLTALGLVLVKMLYLEDKLGERISLPGYPARA